MPNWREELNEAVKTRNERDAEEQARHRKRVQEALMTAEAALGLAAEALKFTCERLKEKGQGVELTQQGDTYKLSLREFSLAVELGRESAILRVTYVEGKPREFDFAKDRHITPVDVEEYVGRRAVEFVRAAQKAAPW